MAAANENARAVGGVLAILAVIAGIWAIYEPMTQRIDQLETEITVLRQEIAANKETDRTEHQELAVDLEGIRKDTEHNTQCDSILTGRIDYIERRLMFGAPQSPDKRF